MSQNSTERPTATYASTVEHQVMSQNTTTLPTSNVPVGKKKKGKTPNEQGVCIGEKVSQEEKIPSSRFCSITKARESIKKTHPMRMNSWVVREKVSLKEKFPTSMNFRVKKTQLSPKLWELKKQIMCDVKIGCSKE